MALVLIATDIHEDPCLATRIIPSIEKIGFSASVVYPLKRICDVIRMVSLACGHVDDVLPKS